jgi:hypothetical protein
MVAVAEKERAAFVFVPGWRKYSSELFFLGSGYAGVGILRAATLLWMRPSSLRRPSKYGQTEIECLQNGAHEQRLQNPLIALLTLIYQTPLSTWR